jgi:alkylation response protein AidB-like acyl-CoA dehydrogenase
LNLLGKENQGFRIVMSNFNHERLWLAITALRMARVCIEDAYSHAITRKAFSQAFFANQVIRTIISTMGRAIENMHALVENLISLYHGQSW